MSIPIGPGIMPAVPNNETTESSGSCPAAPPVQDDDLETANKVIEDIYPNPEDRPELTQKSVFDDCDGNAIETIFTYQWGDEAREPFTPLASVTITNNPLLLNGETIEAGEPYALNVFLNNNTPTPDLDAVDIYFENLFTPPSE